MWRSDGTTIPLDRAFYCESCRVITDAETCPLCDSREHNQRLDGWMDREAPINVFTNGVVISITPAPASAPAPPPWLRRG